MLDKGSYLLEVRGVKTGTAYNILIKARDFIDIKKLSGTKEYTVYKNSRKQITINMDPAENESDIKYSGCLTGYDTKNKVNTPKNKPLLVTDKLGTYTGTATTSEGVVFNIK